MHEWVGVALEAVEPRRLTREGIDATADDAVTVIAIGKAAPAMCWGAHDALGSISGICVTNTDAPVPSGIELLVGDHPVPGDRSFEAGRRLVEAATRIEGRCLSLISGGGSSLCEHPRAGIDPASLAQLSQAMLDGGVPIDEMNLVRQHLSSIKGGGLAALVPVPIETYVISDVGGKDPGLVASGPTIPSPANPQRVMEILTQHEIEVDDRTLDVIRSTPRERLPEGSVTVLADGRTAGESITREASQAGMQSVLADRWIQSDVAVELNSLFESALPGLTVAVGEPTIQVRTRGRGGRNTHAALMAATMLAGSEDLFMAFATDGVDGRSNAAGAVVDGTTLRRGGDPSSALESFDSADYLSRTDDLIVTGPTGTNVSDLWVLWRS